MPQKSNPLPKSNTAPYNGVDVDVLIVKVFPPTGDGPTTIQAVPLQSKVFQFKPWGPKKTKTLEEGKNYELLYEKTTLKTTAFGDAKFFKMFNCHQGGYIASGAIYRMMKVTVTRYDKDEEIPADPEDPVGKPAQKIKKKVYNLDVTDIVPLVKATLESYIEKIPFAERSFDKFQDFYDPINSEGYNPSWDFSKSVPMKLIPYSTLMDNKWFPNQPNETIYVQFPDAKSCEFRFTPDDKKPDETFNTIGGAGKNQLQLYVNQRLADGTDMHISAFTRCFDEMLRQIQIPNWKAFAPNILPHLCGYITGSTDRTKTMDCYMVDPEEFGSGGGIYINSHLSINMKQTLETAVKPSTNRCGIKVSAAIALKVFRKYKNPNACTPLHSPFPFVNAVNILEYPGVKEAVIDDKYFDFYFLSNYPWIPKNVVSLDAMTDDQKFEDLCDSQNYLGGETYIHLFAAYNDSIRDDGPALISLLRDPTVATKFMFKPFAMEEGQQPEAKKVKGGGESSEDEEEEDEEDDVEEA